MAKNAVNKIVGFVLKVIDFLIGKARSFAAIIKRSSPVSKTEAIEKVNAALGERDKALAERDNAIRERDRANRDVEFLKESRKDIQSDFLNMAETAKRYREDARAQRQRAEKAETERDRARKEASDAKSRAADYSTSTSAIERLTRTQGQAILNIYQDINKLLGLCYTFMQRPASYKNNDEDYAIKNGTTSYRGDDGESIPDRSNADYGEFDHKCDYYAQKIAKEAKENHLDKCIVVNISERAKMAEMFMDRANALQDYKEKFEKIRKNLEDSGFGKEKIRRINSITKNLNYVISVVTTISKGMASVICLDRAA